MSWVHQIPSQWRKRRLRFDARLNPVKSELDLSDDTEVSFVPMDAVSELGGLVLDATRPIDEVYNGYTYFANGDVIVAKITPCFENGKGALAQGLANGVAFGTTELHVVRPLSTIDARFLFYLTIANDFRSFGEAEMVGAGGQKRVPEHFLKDWRAPLPPLETQRRIADFLDAKTAQIDGLLEKKRALLDRLSDRRQALITHAVTKGLDPAAPMKSSGIDWLGAIPAHWGVQRLRFSVQKIEQGWSPQCDNRPAQPGEWGVLKVGCVNREFYDEAENKALPPELDPVEHYEVKIGDILVSRANTKELLGSASLVEITQGKIILSDKLYRLTLRDGYDPKYVIGVLRSPLSRFQYEQDATGTSGSMQNISQDTIKNLVHPLPPYSEQVQIGKFLSALRAEADALGSQVSLSLSRMHEYRAAIITAAVTGKISGLQ